MPMSNTPLYLLSACVRGFHVGPKNENKSFIIKIVCISFQESWHKIIFSCFQFCKVAKKIRESEYFCGEI